MANAGLVLPPGYVTTPERAVNLKAEVATIVKANIRDLHRRSGRQTRSRLRVADNLTFAMSYEDVQRKAETQELKFEDDMRGEEARSPRAERTGEATGRKVPAKPTLSGNLLDQKIQKVVSEARQARLALTVKPKNGLATKGTSEVRKGLVRSIQVERGSLEIRLWAAAGIASN